MTLRAHVLITSLLAPAFFVGTLATAQTQGAIVKPEPNVKGMKNGSIVEFQMVKFGGEDGYPRYKTVDPNGPMGNASVSLRCVERAYDLNKKGQNVAWTYNEVFVFDEAGRVVKRKEPRANVESEKGWSFRFKNYDECDKAMPTIMTDDAVCVMKLQLSKANNAAKFISASCTPGKAAPAVPASATTGTKKTTP